MEDRDVVEASNIENIEDGEDNFSDDASQLQQQVCGKEIEERDKEEERDNSQWVGAVGQDVLEERDVADEGEEYIIGGNEDAAAYIFVEIRNRDHGLMN